MILQPKTRIYFVILFAAATVVFFARQLILSWPQVITILSKASPAWLIITLLATAGLYFFQTLWWALLVDPRRTLNLRSHAGALFLASFARYLPGTVWQYMGRVVLYRQLGFRRATIGGAILVETALLVGISFILGVAFTPTFPVMGELSWQLRLVVIALGGIVAILGWTFFKRLLRLMPWGKALGFDSPALPIIVVIMLISMTYSGLLALGWARTFGVPISFSLLQVTGALAFSWLVGFVIVIAPAGLGVFDFSLVAVLQPIAGAAAATLMALAMRVALLGWDLGMALWAARSDIGRKMMRALLGTAQQAPESSGLSRVKP